MTRKIGKFEFTSDDDNDVAYLKLPDHPGEVCGGAVKRTIRLLNLIPEYKGADIFLHFDNDQRLIGIEVLDD